MERYRKGFQEARTHLAETGGHRLKNVDNTIVYESSTAAIETPPQRETVNISQLTNRAKLWRRDALKSTSIEVGAPHTTLRDKGKGFPYSLPSVGTGADPGVQAVSPQVTITHQPGGRLPLLSARPAVTFPAAQHHRPWPIPSYTAW